MQGRKPNNFLEFMISGGLYSLRAGFNLCRSSSKVSWYCTQSHRCAVPDAVRVMAESKQHQPVPSEDITSGPCTGEWKLQHMKGDLFSCHPEESLAHCISEDCRMGAGIAVLFKKKFGGVEDLKAQKKLTGECAVLKRSQRYVYYLITKKKYCHKPTYGSLRRSLIAMKAHCLQNGVAKISMPRIGCGLDRLVWEKVEVMLEDIFHDTDISITVYTL